MRFFKTTDNFPSLIYPLVSRPKVQRWRVSGLGYDSYVHSTTRFWAWLWLFRSQQGDQCAHLAILAEDHSYVVSEDSLPCTPRVSFRDSWILFFSSCIDAYLASTNPHQLFQCLEFSTMSYLSGTWTNEDSRTTQLSTMYIFPVFLSFQQGTIAVMSGLPETCNTEVGTSF